MDKDNSMSRNNPSRHSILVTSNINAANDANRLSELCRQLEIRGYRLFQAPSRKVALDFLGNAAPPAGILLLVAEPTGENEAAQLAALDELRQVAPSIPLFLLFRQLRIEQLSSQLLDEAQGCFNLAAGPARFIAERIDSDLREWRAPAGPRRLRDYAPPVPRTPVSARYNGRARLDLAPAKQWRIGSGSTAERLATPLNDLSTAYRKTSAGAPAAHAGDIAEAFRRALWKAAARLAREDGDTWFFEILRGNPGPGIEAGRETPAKRWHGLAETLDSSPRLDPLRVALSAPGLDSRGRPASFGVPAAVVCRYLRRHGIAPLRTGDYRFLLLFPQGARAEHAQPLVDRLCEFKRRHDDDAPLKQVLPELLDSSPLYRYIGLRELCAMIHEASLRLHLTALADAAARAAGHAALAPATVYGHLVRDETEAVAIDRLGGRVVASLVGVHPAATPLLLPGERVAEESPALIDYLLALQAFGEHFPGFAPELQGIEIDERGRYRVRCVRPAALARGSGLRLATRRPD